MIISTILLLIFTLGEMDGLSWSSDWTIINEDAQITGDDFKFLDDLDSLGD